MQKVKSKTNTNLLRNENIPNKCVSDMNEGLHWYFGLKLQILTYIILYYSYFTMGKTEVKK